MGRQVASELSHKALWIGALFAALAAGVGSLPAWRVNLLGLSILRALKDSETGTLAGFCTVASEQAVRLGGSRQLIRPRHRAWAFLVSGQTQRAKSLLEESLLQDDCGFVCQDLLAQIHLLEGEAEEGLSLWRRAEAPARLLFWGTWLANQGNTASAEAAYQMAVEVGPYYEPAYYPLGWAVLSRTGNPEQTLGIFKQAAERFDSSPWPAVNIGELYANTGRLSLALDWFRQAVTLAPADAGVREKLVWAHKLQGDAWRLEGRWDDAEGAYLEALRLLPRYLDAVLGLAELEFQRLRDDVALDYLQSALKIDPTDHRNYLLLGDLHRGKKPTIARDFYRRAETLLRRAEPSAATHASLAIVLAHQGRFSEAIEEIKQALHQRPDEPWYHLSLGDIYREGGWPDKAREPYFRASQLAPHNPVIQQRMKMQGLD